MVLAQRADGRAWADSALSQMHEIAARRSKKKYSLWHRMSGYKRGCYGAEDDSFGDGCATAASGLVRS
jgi:hypothetical protein